MEPTHENAAFLAEAINRAYGPDDARAIALGFAEAEGRPVTLRANALKTSRDDVARALKAAGIAFEGVAWYGDAFVCRDVRERALWELPIYRDGDIYLQSLSSMIPVLALAPREGADILDMCAAPGGKTLQIAAMTGGRSHLTACEMSAPRSEKLRYNLDKLGARGVNVMRVDARRLDEFFSFDQILLDAPCTGSGTVRGAVGAAGRITKKLLDKTTRSQRALLERALTVLKPGGELVYSTCSILPEENEEQVRHALARHRDCEIAPIAVPSETDADADADEDLPAVPDTVRAIAEAVDRGEIPVLPNGLPGTITVRPSHDYEGFYVARIKKKAR